MQCLVLIAKCPKFHVGKVSPCLITGVCLPVSMQIPSATLQFWVARQGMIYGKSSIGSALRYLYYQDSFPIAAVIPALKKLGCALFPCESFISQTHIAMYKLLVETVNLWNLNCP